MGNEIVTKEKRAAVLAESVSKWLLSDIQKGAIKAIPGYNVQTEVYSALMKIAQTKDRNGKPALDVCTKDSICVALKDLVILGLSITKDQGYFIVYGNQLYLQKSYFGNQYVFSRFFPNLKPTVNVAFEGDDISYMHDDIYDFDYIKVNKAEIENRNNPIRCAYGSIVDITKEKKVDGCVMSWKEIEACWAHGKSTNVQKEFPQEMAKRTLLNRMLKNYIKSSTNQDDAVVRAYLRTTENEFENEPMPTDTADSSVDKMIRQKSKGAEGLNKILKKAETPKEEPKKESSVNGNTPKQPVDEIETESGEIIQVPKSDASTSVYNDDDEFQLFDPDSADVSTEEEYNNVEWR